MGDETRSRGWGLNADGVGFASRTGGLVPISALLQGMKTHNHTLLGAFSIEQDR